jgi:hypothetical protein
VISSPSPHDPRNLLGRESCRLHGDSAIAGRSAATILLPCPRAPLFGRSAALPREDPPSVRAEWKNALSSIRVIRDRAGPAAELRGRTSPKRAAQRPRSWRG